MSGIPGAGQTTDPCVKRRSGRCPRCSRSAQPAAEQVEVTPCCAAVVRVHHVPCAGVRYIVGALQQARLPARAGSALPLSVRTSKRSLAGLQPAIIQAFRVSTSSGDVMEWPHHPLVAEANTRNAARVVWVFQRGHISSHRVHACLGPVMNTLSLPPNS